MFFIAYTFKGHMHVLAGGVKIVSHSSCRTSAILKYFCPLRVKQLLQGIRIRVMDSLMFFRWQCGEGLGCFSWREAADNTVPPS